MKVEVRAFGRLHYHRDVVRAIEEHAPHAVVEEMERHADLNEENDEELDVLRGALLVTDQRTEPSLKPGRVLLSFEGVAIEVQVWDLAHIAKVFG